MSEIPLQPVQAPEKPDPPRGAVEPAPNELYRGLSTASALGLNVIDMVGVGPFVTLPLIVGVMGGPQAILGWIMGALLSLCDGLIWSELGTAYPEAGGSYAYLKHLYGEKKLGRLFSFLYSFSSAHRSPSPPAASAFHNIFRSSSHNLLILSLPLPSSEFQSSSAARL